MAATKRTSAFMRARAAEPLELAILQDAQELHLHRGGDVADFVEKQRAAFCELDAPGLALRGAGERALLVAEESRSRAALSGSAANGPSTKGPRRSRAQLVNTRATSSLPLPLSPRTSTVATPLAARASVLSSSFIASD